MFAATVPGELPMQHQRNPKSAKVATAAERESAVQRLLAPKVFLLLSLAVLLTVIAISLLMGEAAGAEIPVFFDQTARIVEADIGAEIPYDRDAAVVLAEQRDALVETAGYSPSRVGSALGAGALAIGALGWAVLLLGRLTPVKAH